VVGDQSQEAQDALTAAGFGVHIDYQPDFYTGVVTAQDPPGGSLAPAGSTVTITVDDEAPCCSP
jgi:beta-lactam-binding protein with PASTA domain